MKTINGVKVFSATKAEDRAVLGEAVTAWMRSHPTMEVVDTVITQSSDSRFHCLSITVFYLNPEAAARQIPKPRKV